MIVDKTINISVQNKIAMADGTIYICGNSDFIVEFDFDREWDGISYKTARFQYNNTHMDIVFAGNSCPVPVLSNINSFKIGVFVGNLQTSTSALVYAKKSILCEDGIPAAPSRDVYNQILALLNDLDEPNKEEIESIVEEYLAEHPGSVSGEFATNEEILALLKDT